MLCLSMASLLLAACAAVTAGSSSTPAARPLPLADPVHDKNFPLFVHLASRQGQSLLREDKALAALAAKQRERLIVAVDACAGLAVCYVEAVRWHDDDVRAAGAALRARCRAEAAACARVMGALRADGTMIRFHHLDDGEMLASAWMLQAGSADRLLQVYGLGTPPRYPAIDSMASDPQSREFANHLRGLVQDILNSGQPRRTFFDDALQFALGLLHLDGRDEAGRYEPMDRGENRAAQQFMRRIRWSDHPYTALLVPGQGPDSPDVRLSPTARERLAAAVARYNAGDAPLLIVSGGHVHPARTPYGEALEMKRALVEDFGVPARAILIDPHARHTTSNLRNAARLLFRYGAPMDQPMLVVTDASQARYIASDGFDTRNRTETGVLPYRDKQQLSPTTVRVVPVVDALQVGFEDALDP